MVPTPPPSMSQTFDIIYMPIALLGQKTDCFVMARGVEAIDRTHALLWWVRRDVGLTVDPVEMYEQPYEHIADCGCSFYVSFETERLGSLARLRTGETAVPVANIECEPCDEHAEELDAPQTHHDWNGTFAAWSSDPKRADAFVMD